ncbi:DUF924 family protein [Marinobacter sp. S6332]|uniref:DUF924 family protein n=1 Tax=Marinobacter sp. S6332 TaxID=2926403 RepID=UPI001FF5AD1D|nr:DUF924 family protein [Marinobacter sp. S6332]MCK0165320.1 DUF924 domain-containing protein [Marinobacter sp. S6332]
MFDWKEILDFWFGDLDENGLPDSSRRNRWFRSTRKFDQEIRRRFLSMVLFASEQGLEHWRKAAGGRLAEIILLDQFSRNIFRGGALAFEQDKAANKLCKEAMRKGQDMALPPIQRAFVYMPLQHSERSGDQALSVECFEQLVASTSGVLQDNLKGFLRYARDHQEVIERFGRFPHRNQALGRVSSEAEKEFLGTAPRYGQ